MVRKIENPNPNWKLYILLENKDSLMEEYKKKLIRILKVD